MVIVLLLGPRWAYQRRAIAITNDGLKYLISQTELKLVKHYQGNWKEVPGIFFQDIVILVNLVLDGI